MNLGTDPLEAAQQLRVVVERQVRIQTVDDVELGERLVRAAAKLVPRLLERHRVGGGVGRLQPRKRAEQAARHADVSRLETEVVVAVRARGMTLLAPAVCERTDGAQVGSGEQR